MANSVEEKVINVGSRSSQLAMIQTRTIVETLKTLHPSLQFQIKTMETIGDKVLDKPLSNIGQVNLFTKELEVALAEGQVDFIVHSLKDLPTTLPRGMTLAAIYKRDNPTDSLVLSTHHRGLDIDSLPSGSTIGTSSQRRVAQLKRHYPQFRYKSIRGNLNTRLAKLDSADSQEYDGIILATAGIERMGWVDRITQELDSDKCMYAVGQGALAVETRADDCSVNDIVKVLNDADTVLCCTAEREFLKVLEGGCSVPVGVRSFISDGRLLIKGAVFSLDGSEMVDGEIEKDLPGIPADMSVEVCETIGRNVGNSLAKDLISKGASEILRRAKQENEKLTQELSQ